jgi:1-acyl-sn-glycerol-3-phosphate acyltransferase
MWHPLTRPWYRRLTGFFQSQWFSLVAFIFGDTFTPNYMPFFQCGTALTVLMTIIEHYCGIKYVFTGDATMLAEWSDERKFVISNHRTRLDWAFLWPLGVRMGKFIVSLLRTIDASRARNTHMPDAVFTIK